MSLFTFSSPIRDLGATVPAAFGGGIADLRPLTAGEVEPLQAVFDGMSATSRQDRYLTAVVQLTSVMRNALTAVDGHTHVAWLASVGGTPAGIGRYVQVAPCTVEVAFEVVDEHQGRGLGGILLDAVTTVAAVSGIRRVQASLASSNERSLRLLTGIGLTARPSRGTLEAEGPLRLLDRPRLDRPAVVRLHRAAFGAGAGTTSGVRAG